MSQHGREQQGLGGHLSVDLVRLSVEFEHEGVKPNVQAQLLAAEANAAFWRKSAEESEISAKHIATIQAQARSVAKRMRESMRKAGMLDTVH